MPEQGGRARSILYICDFNAHGGTQTHLLHLFESLDRRRYTPSLATLNLHPELARRLTLLDVEVTNLELEGAFRPATLGKAAALASMARGAGVDLLHGFLFQGNLLTAAVSKLSGLPCITSVRNIDLWKKRRHHLASAAAHRRAIRVVFNSSAVREHTAGREKIAEAKMVVIYNGVGDVAVSGLPLEPPLFEWGHPIAICVASLRPKKGHTHLLDAFRLVLTRVPAARLVLVGEGPLRDELRSAVADRGLGGAVLFAGYRPDVASMLRTSDVFVLSSLEEGMPNALLEAMSAGLPSVVTDVGGAAEVVVEGVTGYLVPPAQPELMSQRLSTLLGDADLRRRQGSEARRRYEAMFTVDRMAAAYQALYDEVL